MDLPNPLIERERRKEREGFAQYLLACLILGGKPRGWNKPSQPSEKGLAFLQDLDQRCFGACSSSLPEFYWEFELQSRIDSEPNRWPDLAAKYKNRLVIFELKTEPGSVREGQVDEQIDLALFNFPDLAVDMVYLTRDSVSSDPEPRARARYANIQWCHIAPLIKKRWAQDQAAGFYAEMFAEYLLSTFPPRAPGRQKKTAFSTGLPKATRIKDTATTQHENESLPTLGACATSDPLVAALHTEQTKIQTAVERTISSPCEAERARKSAALLLLEYNKNTAEPICHALPWIWTPSQGGTSLTEVASETGFELRFSYYKKGNGMQA